MSKWVTTTLADHFSLRARIGWQGLRSDEFTSEGPTLITGTDFHDGTILWDKCYHVEEWRYFQDPGIQIKDNDLLITKDGTIGKIAFVKSCPPQTTLNSGVFVVRETTKKASTHYLFYILASETFDRFKRNILTGSTIKHLNQATFYKMNFDMPQGTAEQSKIADVLTAIDTVIEKTKAIIAKYQKIKEGMLQDLLTNGIDEHGQIRSPKTHKYKPSKLGMIPVEWECIQLDHAARIFSGSTPSTANDANWNGNIVWLTPADLSMVKYQYACNSERYITPTGLSNSTNRLLPMGSLILSTRAPVGYCAIVQMEFSFNQGCKGLVPFQYIDPLCLYYVLTIQKKALERFSSGTTFLELPKKELARFLLKMPKRNESGLCEQRKISSKLQQIDAVIERYDETLAKLELQKQGLMQDLLTNKVSVEPLLKKGGQT